MQSLLYYHPVTDLIYGAVAIISSKRFIKYSVCLCKNVFLLSDSAIFWDLVKMVSYFISSTR